LSVSETQIGNVPIFTPTSIIIITDGQIIETDVFYQSIRPAIIIGLTISAIRSAAKI
jgi:F0F1-type ATP synthase alpha subunit